MKKKIVKDDKIIDALYKAVIKYVESRDGSISVIGGIALVEEGTAKYNYGVMVRITGKKPRRLLTLDARRAAQLLHEEDAMRENYVGHTNNCCRKEPL